MTTEVEAAIARLAKITTRYDEIAHEAPLMLADEFAADVKALRTLISAYREAERDAEIANAARKWNDVSTAFDAVWDMPVFDKEAVDAAAELEHEASLALVAAIAKGGSHAG